MKKNRTDRKNTPMPTPSPWSKGRRYVRRGNVLRYGVTPKTRSSLADRAVKRPLPVATMRAVYIFCGLLFLGTGMYSMLF